VGPPGAAPAAAANATPEKFVIPKEAYETDKPGTMGQKIWFYELEINQYPEYARRQLAFGRNLKGVEEKTTAKCQLKGQYRGPQTQGPQVDKLLYVEISGPTLAVVQRAKSAVHAMIEDFAKKTLQIGKR